jgi:uncharacterized protein with HEPN domain
VAIDSYVIGLTLEQFLTDRKAVDAVVRNLEVIGEAAKHLPCRRERIARRRAMDGHAGMRNILSQEYFGVDLTIVWHTGTVDVPLLRAKLLPLVDAE